LIDVLFSLSKQIPNDVDELLYLIGKLIKDDIAKKKRRLDYPVVSLIKMKKKKKSLAANKIK
jgi:hypothetical protein